MGLREKQSLFLRDVAKLIQFAFSHGIELTGGELLRTQEQQLIYVKTGRSKTMNSRHLLKLAIDFYFFIDGRMLFQDRTKYAEDVMLIKPLGDFWESLSPDNVWGSDWDRDDNLLEETFRDPYHFEKRP